MINSRSLLDLKDDFRAVVGLWLEDCAKAGLNILVVSTLRDNEYQDYLYSLGRMIKGKICTNARGGQSEHNTGNALDFCVMAGKVCDWNNKAAFQQAGILAERRGLAWAGRWTGKLRETGHIQKKKGD